MKATITVEGINVDLLREQRDHLIILADFEDNPKMTEGVISLLDTMLDIAEGYGSNL